MTVKGIDTTKIPAPAPTKVQLTTIDEFLSLPKYEQLDIIFKKGDFVEARTNGKLQEILYSLDVFVVELSFDPSVLRIINVKAYDPEDIMGKYFKDRKGDASV